MTVAFLLLAAFVTLGRSSDQPSGRPPQPARDYTRFDVCQLVPGDAVARAVGATLTQARPFFDAAFSRCTYLIVGADGKPGGHVVWVQPASDFEELRKVHEKPVTPVNGLGDAAYMFRDEDGRFKIYVLKRNDLMFQATGDTADSARKVADLVVAILWKKRP